MRQAFSKYVIYSFFCFLKNLEIIYLYVEMRKISVVSEMLFKIIEIKRINLKKLNTIKIKFTNKFKLKTR